MTEVGDRVKVNRTVLDTDNLPVREGAAGIVIGHRGETPIVALDDGRYVEWEARAFAPVRALKRRQT
jgi:hypothetical protein